MLSHNMYTITPLPRRLLVLILLLSAGCTAESEDEPSEGLPDSLDTIATVEPPPPPPPPPIDPASPLVVASQRRLLAADSALQDLVDGSAAFTAPDSMYLDESAVLRLLIAPSVTPSELTSSLRARLRARPERPDEIRAEEIRISDVMRAELSGAGFEIIPAGPVDKAMSAREETQWTWQVTARNRGEQNLILTVEALVQVGGSDRWRPLQQLEDTIAVTISPEQRSREEEEQRREEEERQLELQRDRESAFWERMKNLWWLWATILAPLGLWIYKRLKAGPKE